jgi:hypothetical protein
VFISNSSVVSLARGLCGHGRSFVNPPEPPTATKANPLLPDRVRKA